MPLNKFLLISEQDKEKFVIPEGETVIGRGPFLKVRDKQVSRSHAVITLKNGDLQIKPIHDNPTFICANSCQKFSALKKNVWKELKHGDSVSLLPDCQIFSVVREGSDDKKAGSQIKENEQNSEERNIDPTDKDECVAKNNKEAVHASSQNDVQSLDTSRDVDVEVDVPFQATLEDSIDSIDSDNIEKTKDETDPSSYSKPVEKSSPEKNEDSVVVNESSKRNQESLKDKKRKLPSWMLGSSTVAGSASASSNTKNKKQKTQHKKEDNESNKKEKVAKVTSKVSKVSKATTETPVQVENVEEPKNIEPFATKNTISDEEIIENNDDVPKNDLERPSATTQKDVPGSDDVDIGSITIDSERRKEDVVRESSSTSASAVNDSESKEENLKTISQKLPKCQYGKSCYRKNPLHFEAFSHSDDEEDKDVDDSEKPECPFGTSCYRQNPQHKAEYKHTKPPEEPEPNTRKSTRKTKRKSILTGESDDDDGENTYDYDDSFLDDAEVDGDESSSYDDDDEDEDFVPGDDEDVEELIEEANQIKEGK